MADNNPVDIQKHLSGIDFPATKQEIIEHVQQHDADESVISALKMLPERNFSSMNEVSAAVGAIL